MTTGLEKWIGQMAEVVLYAQDGTILEGMARWDEAGVILWDGERRLFYPWTSVNYLDTRGPADEPEVDILNTVG